MKNLVIVCLFFLVSCAGYVDSLHRQIDREEKIGKARTEEPKSNFAPYRNRFNTTGDKRPVKNPLTYSLGSDPSGQRQPPPVKREYRQMRAKADDFVDKEDSGSLWADQGSSSSLFTYQNDKHMGDMVIINVLEDLRNQISAELKRQFPDAPRKGKTVEGGGDKGGDPKAGASSLTPPAAEHEMDMKVYDKISGTVTEEISKDYIVLKGRKEVIFKKEKRSIEVQALVSRKDIMENDYVNSDKLLESRVFILGVNR
jgi:flagellar basal body L-ring protein FlgH